MKKGLKFTKDQLEDLYWNKKLSLSQIGEKFGCNGTNVLYWLKKFNVKRRPADYRKINIPKRILEDLYWNKNMSSTEIAKKFGVKHSRTIAKKLKKYGIRRKTQSEAIQKNLKRPLLEIWQKKPICWV